MIKLEIDLFNRKRMKQLEGENLIMKQQLANYRNEILEWNRRYKNEPSRNAETNKG